MVLGMFHYYYYYYLKGVMESINPEVDLYCRKLKCIRTDTVFFLSSNFRKGMVALGSVAT